MAREWLQSLIWAGQFTSQSIAEIDKLPESHPARDLRDEILRVDHEIASLVDAIDAGEV